MEVIIDRNECGNCQLCADACPQVFKIQEGAVAVLFENVPPAFEADCLFARETCPVHAIEICNTDGIYRDG